MHPRRDRAHVEIVNEVSYRTEHQEQGENEALDALPEALGESVEDHPRKAGEDQTDAGKKAREAPTPSPLMQLAPVIGLGIFAVLVSITLLYQFVLDMIRGHEKKEEEEEKKKEEVMLV